MPIYIGGNELDNLAIGANELDKAYLGTSLLYEKTSPIASVPRRIKLLTDYTSKLWKDNYGDFSYYYCSWTTDMLLRPNWRHDYNLYVTNTENTIVTFPTYNGPSNSVSAMGGIGASYSLANGWSFGTRYPLQNMTAYFPTDMYDNSVLVPASGMTLKYDNSIISREADFTTLEPVPLPSFFPNVNLDTIFNTYYTAPYPWYTDIMGVIDDNTVGFIRAFWSASGEASFGCQVSSSGQTATYTSFWTTYYHSNSTQHSEFIFKLNRTTGAVIYNSQIMPATGRHYFDDYFKFTRTSDDEKVTLYTNIMGYPEMNMPGELFVT